MLSKLRKLLRFAPQFFTIIGAVSMAVAMLLSVVNIPVSANGNGQETCPANGSWHKVDGLSGKNYTFNAPAGKLIAEWCYKSSTKVVTGVVNPPKASVTVTSTVTNKNGKIQDLSHASFKLVNKPTNTPPPPPTNTPTNTATFTATFTPTNTPVTPTNTATFTPTNTPVAPTFTPSNTPTNTPVAPTFTPSNTPTNTPIPDDPDPTQTPGGPTATNTPTDDPTATPTNTQPPATPTATVTEEPKDPDPTGTPVTDETPDPTEPPVTDETPDPTEPPVTDETPEPTLAPPVSNDPPAVLIPVTGIELSGNSPLSDAQNFIFNMGLSFLGLGLVLQSVRKRFNF